VVDEHVVGAHRREDVVPALLGQESHGNGGNPLRVLQLRPIERGQLEERGKVERRVHDLEVALIHLQLANQQVANLVRHPLVDLESDDEW